VSTHVLALEATIWRRRVARLSDGLSEVGGVVSERRMSSYVLTGIPFAYSTERACVTEACSPGGISRYPASLTLSWHCPWQTAGALLTTEAIAENLLFLLRNQEHIIEGLKKKKISFLEFVVIS
jgi:hypothetical protein